MKKHCILNKNLKYRTIGIKDVLIKFGLPILTSLITYAVAGYQYKTSLKKKIKWNKTVLEKRELCCGEIG